MEGISALASSSSHPSALSANLPPTSNAVATATLLDSSSDQDLVGIDFSDLYKHLTVTSQKIIDKINELLKEKLPNGVQSLQPEEVTPDATAERIVQGATSSFENYKKQHPELSNDEVLTNFMKAVRSGVQDGYNDAFTTLKDLGAFDVQGVQQGIEQTKILIEEKLNAFEDHHREKQERVSTAPQTSNDDTTQPFE